MAADIDEPYFSLTALEGMVTANNKLAPSQNGTMQKKKKRKTVAELEEDGTKRLRQADKDHALAVSTLAVAKEELAAMRPLLLQVFERDPALRAILRGVRRRPGQA